MKIGIAGTGGMGTAIARRLLESGHEVLVWNRTVYNAYDARAAGAKWAPTLAELVAETQMVITFLSDNAAVERVYLGADGLLAGRVAGRLFIDMSTVSPAVSRRLHEAGRRKRVSVLDAPVSGTTSVAQQGQLIIFVGGDESVYEQCKPILSTLGKTSFYMGPSGSGAIMKLCTNTMLGLGMQALAEAVTLGLKAGLPREHFLEVLANTAVVSPSQKSKLGNVLNEVYPTAFPLRLMHKDFKLILNTAANLSAAMPVTAAAEQVYAVEADRQFSTHHDEDFSSIVRATERTVAHSREQSLAKLLGLVGGFVIALANGIRSALAKQ